MLLINEPIQEVASVSKRNIIKKSSKSVTRFISDPKDIYGQDIFVDFTCVNGKNQVNYEKVSAEILKNFDKYKDKIIIIPVDMWQRAGYDIRNDNCAPNYLINMMHRAPDKFKDTYAGYVIYFIHTGSRMMIPINVDEYKNTEYNDFIHNLGVMLDLSIDTSTNTVPTSNLKIGSENKDPVNRVVDVSKFTDLEIKRRQHALTAAIQTVSMDADNDDEVISMINNDLNAKEAIIDIEDVSQGVKLSVARTSRIAAVNKQYLSSKINNKTVSALIDDKYEDGELPKTDLSKRISTINDDWDHLTYMNFQDAYDIDVDMAAILYHFGTINNHPVMVRNVLVEDTSDSMDYIYNYRVEMEDDVGKRFTLNFDIPKFKNKRFMRLRGNDKVVSGQLMLLPCMKSDLDTVQIVSNYGKIFIRRYGQLGKSYSVTDRLLKALKKYKGTKIKVVWGDNGQICNKYELPVDYIDLACNINRIEIPGYILYFDQDIYYTKYNAEVGDIGLPYMVNTKTNEVLYIKDHGNSVISYDINTLLCDVDPEFRTLFDSIKAANKLNFSVASVMAAKIPVAVVLGYHIGLKEILHAANITYALGDTKANILDKEGTQFNEFIKLSDGYLAYISTYSSSMLLNGLCDCDVANYTFKELSNPATWLDFLDIYGGRILADGLDNFKDLMIDPITEKICKRYRLPTDYCQLLIYANNLLGDNKYNRHTDITGNRYRNNEIVAGYAYKCLTKAYTDYRIQVKRGRRIAMSMKKSAVIDAILADPMASDLSILNPLLEIESANTVSFKGLAGMNADRAYGLDKRTYDDSMINKLALSTGFSANVGIARQTTIDMNIESKRGYIRQDNPKDLSVARTLSMSEAITPFGTTRDDPFRSAMTFIQTSKHSMRPAKSMPLLITNGADEAMAYIASDTYAYKAKEDGIVEEVTPEYMIVSYAKDIGDGYTKEYIDLSIKTEKNSDGGFYVNINLDTDLKVGAKFKKGDIVAYDRTSFSNKIGESDNLAYDLGVFAKIVIMNNDEGFEDNTSVSDWMSEAMASDITVMKDINISKAANIYDIVKPGQKISEGDPLIIFQNAFDETEANALLKNVTDDSEFVSDLGRIRLKSKFTGIIQTVKVYRTCDIDDTMSPSMKKFITDYEKKIKAKRALYKKHKLPNANLLDPDYKLPQSGKLKNVADGVLIEFYITYHDKLSIGDKTVAQSASKGVVKYIFPKGQEPISEYRPEEKIHSIFAARSFNARMVTSPWTSGALNKLLVELDRQCKDILGIKQNTLEEIQ